MPQAAIPWPGPTPNPLHAYLPDSSVKHGRRKGPSKPSSLLDELSQLRKIAVEGLMRRGGLRHATVRAVHDEN
jgi:hypothetical protein